MRKFIVAIGVFFPVFMMWAAMAQDTPSPGTISLKGGTDGTKIGNQGDMMKVFLPSGVPITIPSGTPLPVVVSNFPSPTPTQSVYVVNQPSSTPEVTISGVPTVSISPNPSSSPLAVKEVSPISGFALESGGFLQSVYNTVLLMYGRQADGTQKTQVTSMPSVSISGTPTVTISGVPTVNIGTIPSVVVSGTPTVLVSPNPQATPYFVEPTDGTNHASFTAANAEKVDLEQYLGAAYSATNSPSCRITNGAAFVDPTQIRALTSSDVVTVAQSTASNLNAQAQGNVPTASTDSGNPLKIGGVFNTILPTFTNGQRGDIQISNKGSILVAGGSPVGSVPADNPVTVAGVDGSGFKRYLLTDANGKLQTDTADGSGNPITSTTVNGKTGLSSTISGADTQTLTGTATAIYNAPTATAVTNGSTSSGTATILLTTTPSAASLGAIVTGSANIPTNAYVTAIGSNQITLSYQTTGIIATTTTLTFTPTFINPPSASLCIAKTDVRNYKSFSLETMPSVTGAFSATLTVVGSNDGNVWFLMPVTQLGGLQNSVTTGLGNGPVATITTAGHFNGQVGANFIEVVATAYASGTPACNMSLSTLPASNAANGAPNVSVIGTTATSLTSTTMSQVGSVSDIASATIVTTTTSASFTPTANLDSFQFIYTVSAENAATTTDVVLQESVDTGTSFRDVWHFERIVGAVTPQLITPRMRLNGNRFRIVETLAGSTKSITRTFAHIGYFGNATEHRRFFDRTIDLNSTSTPSAVYDIKGCGHIQMTVNQASCSGSFPTLAIAISEDGTNFSTTPYTVSTSTNGTFSSIETDYVGNFIEVKNVSAGASCVLGYLAISCKGD